jgi:cation transport regulator ChaC
MDDATKLLERTVKIQLATNEATLTFIGITSDMATGKRSLLDVNAKEEIEKTLGELTKNQEELKKLQQELIQLNTLP